MTVTASHGPSRNKRAMLSAMLAAAMLVIMLMAQLYGFEDFAAVLEQVLQTNDAGASYVTAALLVVTELLALPYLLGMYISPLFRFMSGGLAFGISGFWLFIAFTNSHALNSGFFSSSFVVPGGLAAAAWAALLFFLVATVIMADSRFRHASS